jgi:hypothetical protein
MSKNAGKRGGLLSTFSGFSRAFSVAGKIGFDALFAKAF